GSGGLCTRGATGAAGSAPVGSGSTCRGAFTASTAPTSLTPSAAGPAPAASACSTGLWRSCTSGCRWALPARSWASSRPSPLDAACARASPARTWWRCSLSSRRWGPTRATPTAALGPRPGPLWSGCSAPLASRWTERFGATCTTSWGSSRQGARIRGGTLEMLLHRYGHERGRLHGPGARHDAPVPLRPVRGGHAPPHPRPQGKPVRCRVHQLQRRGLGGRGRLVAVPAPLGGRAARDSDPVDRRGYVSRRPLTGAVGTREVPAVG